MRGDPAGRDRLETYRLVRNLCADVLASDFAPAPGLLLGAARVRPVASEVDLENVPLAGPALVAAGAPYGALQALAASVVLDEIRPDVKVVADRFVAASPNLRSRFVGFDPWERRKAAAANVRAIRQGLAWLRSGGLLLAFVQEDEWASAVRLARLTGAAIVPASVSHRRTGLPENGAVELRFGAPLTSERLAQFALDGEATGYLRWRTNVLAWRHRTAIRLVPRPAGRDAMAACR